MDKKFWQSKKFLALILFSLLVTSILIIALITQQFNAAMILFMGIGIFGLTATSIGYILGQSSLDKFINGVTNLGRGFAGKENDKTTKDDME